MPTEEKKEKKNVWDSFDREDRELFLKAVSECLTKYDDIAEHLFELYDAIDDSLKEEDKAEEAAKGTKQDRKSVSDEEWVRSLLSSVKQDWGTKPETEGEDDDEKVCEAKNRTFLEAVTVEQNYGFDLPQDFWFWFSANYPSLFMKMHDNKATKQEAAGIVKKAVKTWCNDLITLIDVSAKHSWEEHQEEHGQD